MSLLLVACGGAVGAMLRYAIGWIPVHGSFPILTLCINFLGAVLIGLVADAAEAHHVSAKGTLFWKTGVCGGFTTFSTFSLETVTLLETGKWCIGGLYILLSIAACLCGVLLGRLLHRSLLS